MLRDHPIDVVLLATDLPASRHFYAEQVGLLVESEDGSTVTFRCGGAGRLVVSASTTGTADAQTQAAWRVDDLAAELKELRARGVEIEEYDTPGLTTVDGIFAADDALHAWFVDPGGNTLGLNQAR